MSHLLLSKFLSEFEERIPRSEIDQYKDLCTKTLTKYDDSIQLKICGSYRRGKESSFDVDILICHPGNVLS